ncbi:MAG: hypothetical protein M3O71_01825 [Bacteroidota bacterium]|nr:hypothetical protein [Bacteroidota bacterium]
MKISLAILLILGFSVIARAQRPDSLRMRVLFQQCHIDSLHGNYLAAVKHWNQYRSLRDSLLEEYKNRQSAYLERQYQTEKKDLEIRSREKNINLLSSQNRLTDQFVTQIRLTRIIIISAGIAAALLLAASLWQYRHKILANRCLAEQQLAIREQNSRLELTAQLKDDLLGEKELLIKEIHHRVKNNLQIVISLLNTQSAYLNDPHTVAAIRQSQHRMQSISLIHHKLYQSESRALIGFKEYIHELLQYLRQSFTIGSRIAFKITVEDIEMDVLKAVPLGLILNEMITNALRYAFEDDHQGEICVELTCTVNGGLSLMVSDNGRGLPEGFDIEFCDTLGINLIKNMCREIGGVLDFRRERGLSMMIEIPSPSNDDIWSFDGDLKSIPFIINHN